MQRLKINLFGTPEVRYRGELLKFPTRKAQALLFYLLVEGRIHSRPALMSLLWPEKEQGQARTALRVALTHLRQTLAMSQMENPEPYLLIEADRLGFNLLSNIECDLHAILKAFSYSGLPATAPKETRQQAIENLQAAVEVYQGDFLENFEINEASEFENWASLQRESCHRRMELIFERLCTLYLESGQAQQAGEVATRWVARHPLSEAAYRSLMQAHYAGGKRDEALQVYEQCRAMVAAELHFSLSPETLALAEQIRSTALPKSSREIRPVSFNSTAALHHIPLTGRSAEFSELVEEYYYAANFKQPRLVVIQGEAGIGKTRLASEFLHWAKAQGAEGLEGRAFETGGTIPYQSLIEPLRKRLALVNAPDDLLEDVWLAELSQILPELRERYPDLPPPGLYNESAGAANLFEAITLFVFRVAPRQPVLLFVDDLQWTDAATQDALQYMIRRAKEEGFPLLLLGSLRTEGLNTSPVLANWLGNLNRTIGIKTLTLEELGANEILKLLQTLSSSTSATSGELGEFSRWLYEETGGQPFYLIETLKELLEHRSLGIQVQEDGAVILDFSQGVNLNRLQGLLPAGVREIIRNRIGRLSQSGQALLRAGAVLGAEFRFEIMQFIGGLGEDEGLTALEEALVHRLLRDVPGQGRGELYRFVHDKIREVIYQDLNDTRRRIFHRRAFEKLEASGSTPPAELTYHATNAGLLKPALHYSVLAGEQALKVFAVQDAVGAYVQALKLLEEIPANEIEASFAGRIYLELGRAHELQGALVQARQCYEQLENYSQQQNQKALKAQALNRQATLAVQEKLQIHKAVELLERAREAAKASGDTLILAESEWNTAQIGFYGRLVDLLNHAPLALKLAEELGQPELTGRCLNITALSKMVTGYSQEAEELAHKTASLYHAQGNFALEADNLCVAANALFYQGKVRQGIGLAREAVDIARRIGNHWGQVNSLLQLAVGLRESGEYPEALAVSEETVELATKHQVLILLLWAMAIKGSVLRMTKALEQAVTVHQQALELASSMQADVFNELIFAELCADYALLEDWTQAGYYSRQGVEIRSNLFHSYVGFFYWYEVEALVRAGEGERAIDDLERFRERCQASPRYYFAYLRAAAVLEKYQGNSARAIQLLEEAKLLAVELELPGEL